MGVKQIGYEGKVELGVSGNEGGSREEFATIEFVGVGEDLFSALEEIASLERGARAEVWRELVKKDGIVFTVFYVVGKVLNAEIVLAGNLDDIRDTYVRFHFAFFRW